jgi:hypothetical protein
LGRVSLRQAEFQSIGKSFTAFALSASKGSCAWLSKFYDRFDMLSANGSGQVLLRDAACKSVEVIIRRYQPSVFSTDIPEGNALCCE